MATDVLADLPAAEAAKFYRRLATFVDEKAKQERISPSLAAMFMHHWLENRSSASPSTFTFDAPNHLKRSTYVLDVLRFHRRVFLSQEKARVGGGKTELRGIVSRLQGRDRKEKWDGASSIKIDYQSLVEMPLLLQVHGSAGDRDLLYGLRGFQLKSTVRVVGRPLKQGIRVYFEDWQAQISDRYDFDYDEGITVPNPDFGSSAAGAIAPNEECSIPMPNASKTPTWPHRSTFAAKSSMSARRRSSA